MIAPLVPDLCRHGGRAGLMDDGRPWCPICRRDAELAQRRAEHRARLGWTGDRPPVDHRMRAANDDSLDDEPEEPVSLFDA